MTPTEINTIVLASGNAGKLREMREILADASLNIVAQSDYDVSEAVEDGLSFVENALKKARHACKQTGMPAIADDSGLEVDALKGAPGIYSARYAGEAASDDENVQKLLGALKGLPENARGARFVCVIVYLRHEFDPSPIICEGYWRGRISAKAQGENGFGYDPIFYVPQHNCTSAQLSSAQKNHLSHRGIALASLAHRLDASL